MGEEPSGPPPRGRVVRWVQVRRETDAGARRRRPKCVEKEEVIEGQVVRTWLKERN